MKQLGPAPAKDAAPESATIAAERARLDSAHGNVDAALKQARLLSSRVDQLSATIADKRRSAYAQQLLEQSPSALSPFFWGETAAAVPDEANSVVLQIRNWWDMVAANGGWLKLATALLLGCLLSAAVLFMVRWWARRSRTWRHETRLTKAIAALNVFAQLAVAAPLSVFVLLLTVESFGLRDQGWDDFSRAIGIAFLVASFGRGIAVGLFAPEEPDRRLLNIDDKTARLLGSHLIWASVWFGVMMFLLLTHRAVDAPHVLAVATRILLAAGIGGILLTLLLGSSRTVLDADETPGNLWLRTAAWLIVIGIGVSLLLGYAGLAVFIAQRTMVTIAVCASLYMVFVAADALFTEAMVGKTPRGRALAANLGIKTRQIGLIGTVLSGVTFVVVVLVGMVLIAGPWGGNAADLIDSIRSVAFGIRFGGINISLGAVLSALILLLLVLFATRLVQRWLETRLLPNTELEESLRQSITTICGYIGVIAALVVMLSQIGIDPQKIALVAGALSVGIGFGLQSIVSNFVSGLILLAERPIRVGDLISVKGDDGRVTRISVRATEIETPDRASVIVPNSDLITGVVKNKTRADTTTRNIIKIGVAYDSNPEQVRDILLACANDHPRVLQTPAPLVILSNFGDSALEFELYIVLVDFGAILTGPSEIRFEILKRLAAANIEIPFPQRELRWHEDPAAAKGAKTKAASKSVRATKTGKTGTGKTGLKRKR
jgi:small-conductance mechanosensitive channel